MKKLLTDRRVNFLGGVIMMFAGIIWFLMTGLETDTRSTLIAPSIVTCTGAALGLVGQFRIWWNSLNWNSA